jgi:hypothetical protein
MNNFCLESEFWMLARLLLAIPYAIDASRRERSIALARFCHVYDFTMATHYEHVHYDKMAHQTHPFVLNSLRKPTIY